MHPVREEDDDILERLEERVGQISALVERQRQRIEELEAQLRDGANRREAAVREAEEARAQAAHLVEEVDGLRGRNKQAAARVRALLTQMEQLDLLQEN